MLTDAQMEEIHVEANRRGLEAVEKCVPTPMLVGSPTTPFGSDIDYSKNVEFVAGGVCGFAWAIIRPANSRFANFLKRKSYGKYSSYERAVMVNAPMATQSMQLKEAYCKAYSEYIKSMNIHNVRASMMSRMD